MSLLVLKFGGTSLGSAARVRIAARRVRAHVRRGRGVVVVVSAAGRSTDHILGALAAVGATDAAARDGAAAAAEARSSGFHSRSSLEREVDRALATGEDRSAALLAAALWRIGVPARSLRGGEAGVRASGDFAAGVVQDVCTDRIACLIADAIVPVISGFQAVRSDGETITLGRGGSDTSAVAIAAALDAECHIITDVDGVYDRDPRTSATARRLRALDHAALLCLARAGAHVVHGTAAELAAATRTPLRVYHFRAPVNGAGTRIGTRPESHVARVPLPSPLPSPLAPPLPSPPTAQPAQAAAGGGAA